MGRFPNSGVPQSNTSNQPAANTGSSNIARNENDDESNGDMTLIWDDQNWGL
jgi:hypothetical protein